MYSRLKNAKPELFAELKEIWRSPLIASDPMAWRPELDESIKSKIMYFFMTYGRQGTDEEVAKARENLAMIDMGPFIPSSNAQLWPFYEMDQIRQRMSIEGGRHLFRRRADLENLGNQHQDRRNPRSCCCPPAQVISATHRHEGTSLMPLFDLRTGHFP